MQCNLPKERTVAFIVARLSSSRLPAKHLRLIGDRPMLQWVVDKLRNSKELDDIVLATVSEPENLALKPFAEKNGIACFWYEGDVDHVTTRLRRAAESFNSDICVLVSGDCPLIHAPAIDEIIRSVKKKTGTDTVVRLPADAHGQRTALQGIVVGRKKAWQLADDLADRPELKEHQFPVIGMRPELFQPVDVRLPAGLYMPYHRLSVDTLADMAFMNDLYDVLDKRHLPFDLPNVVSLLKERPDLKKINGHVHQRRLVEEIKKVLFVVDAGGRYGFGHLMRCLELARQITERLGWPTHFMVDDHQAKSLIEKTGCKTHWGAFGRPANQDSDIHTPAAEIYSKYDLFIVDIFDQRGPDNGWRANIGKKVSCIVIENTQPWTHEADLVVLPNILDKDAPGIIREKALIGADKAGIAIPAIVGGEQFIILRNEIQRLASHMPKKEIDVLVYLHDYNRRKAMKKILYGLGIEFKVMSSFGSGFAPTLARARVFISGFGVSFNEALALQTLPVCWPDSDSHRDDAASFYRHLGMDPLIIDSTANVEAMILTALDNQFVRPSPLQDGTPNIVAEIASLFDSSQLCGNLQARAMPAKNSF